LSAPTGQNTRPTADRVKENLFNIIAPDLPNSRFLDLFCGSGAIGIEALSRGAAEAVFVDVSAEATRVAKNNLARVKFENQAKVLCMCARKAISQLEREGRGFDIIFLDPPYGDGILKRVIDELESSSLLVAEGIVIIECSDKEAPVGAHNLKLYDTREYGNTRLEFYTNKRKI